MDVQCPMQPFFSGRMSIPTWLGVPPLRIIEEHVSYS
jgi:hypothetical protein